MATCRRQKGFTLIEMLITMTLLSIIVVLLFSSLKIAAESWNAGEGKIIEVNKKAVVYQFFKRHLTTIRPVSTQAPLQNGEDVPMPQLLFQGRPQFMRFVAALPVSAARKGLQVFQIAADTEKPSILMVALSPYQQTEPDQPEKVVLLEHIKAFAFSYFGKKDENSEAAWQEDWTGVDRLPQLIKVSINLDDGSYWPDMVFPVKITGQAAIDAVTPDNSQTSVP